MGSIYVDIYSLLTLIIDVLVALQFSIRTELKAKKYSKLIIQTQFDLG